MTFVIGTAGHIDHGKTALVRRLTGQDTDRLPHEKARGISIDLGFAHLDLEEIGRVGIIDVPGHERFIRNMVAGVHGLDLVLFVIAADDGVMPQTEEHLAILTALAVEKIIVVVTKIDLVDDRRLADLDVEIEVFLDETRFGAAPVIRISNATGFGVNDLKTLIKNQLSERVSGHQGGLFRMPIDRVFSVRGRGTVVTGTVIAGKVSLGDEVVICPNKGPYRVRGLQHHGVDVQSAQTGGRLAINLSGAEAMQFRRGDVACAPGLDCAMDRLDASFAVTKMIGGHINQDVKNGQRVRVYLGTAERRGTVTLLGAQTHLAAGQSGLLQIHLLEPLHAMAQDRFILRNEQGEHMLGGGLVLDPLGRKMRRISLGRIAGLNALLRGETAIAAAFLISDLPAHGLPASELAFRLNMALGEVMEMVRSNQELHLLSADGRDWITTKGRLNVLGHKIAELLAKTHADHPSIIGPGLQSLHHQIAPAVDLSFFREVCANMIARRQIQSRDGFFALLTHKTGLQDRLQPLARALLAGLDATPFSPPLMNNPSQDDKAVIAYLERSGAIVRVAQNMVFAAKAYESAEKILNAHFAANDDISAAEFRDILGTSRKYALGLLESFDKSGRTIRVGERRKPVRMVPDQPD